MVSNFVKVGVGVAGLLVALPLLFGGSSEEAISGSGGGFNIFGLGGSTLESGAVGTTTTTTTSELIPSVNDFEVTTLGATTPTRSSPSSSKKVVGQSTKAGVIFREVGTGKLVGIEDMERKQSRVPTFAEQIKNEPIGLSPIEKATSLRLGSN